MVTADDAALVLFSGGQDSTTCLAWALDRFARVETIGFDYRQRHAIELACRPAVRHVLAAFPAWAGRLKDDHVIDLSVLGAISDTALTRNVEIEMREKSLPNTFVPGSVGSAGRGRSARSASAPSSRARSRRPPL